MVSKNKNIVERDDVVVKFVGDSGDGMQLTGTLFSDTAALAGNDLATYPDYPAEIRAPHNTVAGVSGYQVHIGHNKIHTSGDLCDVLVAMNPASLKANLKWAKTGATIIIDADSFDDETISKAGYHVNPLDDNTFSAYNIVKAPITSMTKEALVKLDLDVKTAEKSRNMFALGIICHLFNWNVATTEAILAQRFKSKPQSIAGNKIVIEAGYSYADTIEALPTYHVQPTREIEKGKYRNITGNIATAWGFLAASERSGRPLFLGSYPITPATDILQELAKHKSLGAKVFQAEDEIAGICSAIGASYTGSLALTTTSGPGFSLKSEAIGLAVMIEIPLVIVNVQRGGPSTGLPTKSEQSDLMQALYGRNGECPAVVMASSSPVDCFYSAYEASKIAMEHMTPVILLSDGQQGNGSELFRIPRVSDLPAINPPIAEPNDPEYKPYKRNAETLVRQWALPGTDGLRHRVGGLEKENISGNITTDPANHQLMINLRQAKVDKIANFVPEQEVDGDIDADLLVVSWGGTKGTVHTAIKEVQAEGKKIAHAHFKYIMPLPRNTSEVLSRYKKIVVCELNMGQFVGYLRMTHPDFKYTQFNKVQGLPFMVSELTNKFNQLLEEK